MEKYSVKYKLLYRCKICAEQEGNKSEQFLYDGLV